MPSTPQDTAVTLRGGVTSGWAHWTWPFGRLQLDHEWAVLRAPGVLASIPRVQVDRVDLVPGTAGSGVRFVTAAGTFDRYTFWQMSPTRVLTALDVLGWLDDESAETA